MITKKQYDENTKAMRAEFALSDEKAIMKIQNALVNIAKLERIISLIVGIYDWQVVERQSYQEEIEREKQEIRKNVNWLRIGLLVN